MNEARKRINIVFIAVVIDAKRYKEFIKNKRDEGKKGMVRATRASAEKILKAIHSGFIRETDVRQ